MIKSIVAVIVSYIAMSAIIIAVFSGLWFGLGPDRLLVPGSWDGNLYFSIAVPGLTMCAGLFGGWLCAKIAPRRGPVMVLASLVLLLGLTMAVFTLQKPAPSGPRPAGMTMAEIMEKGREPAWVAISNPIIGCVAVLIGGLVLGSARKPG